MRIFSPSPTVRASRTPLYMQGISSRLHGLGQDGNDVIDTAADVMPDIPGMVPFDPSSIAAPDFGSVYTLPLSLPSVNTNPLIDQGFTAQQADLISQAAASGAINENEFQAIVSGQVPKSDIAHYISDVAVGLPAPGASRPPSASPVAAATAAAQKAVNTLKTAPVPGPSPRVSATPSASQFFSQASPVPGLPMWGLLAAGGALLLAAVGSRR